MGHWDLNSLITMVLIEIFKQNVIGNVQKLDLIKKQAGAPQSDTVKQYIPEKNEPLLTIDAVKIQKSLDVIRQLLKEDIQKKVLEIEMARSRLKELQKVFEYGNLQVTDKDEAKMVNVVLKEYAHSANFEKKLKHEMNTTFSKNVKIHRKFSEKNYKILTAMIVASLIIVGANLIYFENFIKDFDDKIPSSKYVIENLRGDKVETDKFWKISPDEPLRINLVNSAGLSEEKIEIVKDAILSDESTEIDDNLLHKAPKGSFSSYYLGWSGALSTISEETRYVVPKNLEFVNPRNGVGDIIITLSNVQESDGYVGYTKSITDGDQILKSLITIYDTNYLSENLLATIVRHEFGHALGLGHSTAIEDLMYSEIVTEYPYISECNISAIILLYDGKVNDEVICEK